MPRHCVDRRQTKVGRCSSPRIDCFNNGGEWSDDIGCAFGECSKDHELCNEDGDCAFVDDGYYNNANVCVPFENCHDDQPLDETGILTEPPSNAEPQMCRAAKKSKDTLFSAPACMP